jgi:predicted alpha/beta superfamily hydrolase
MHTHACTGYDKEAGKYHPYPVLYMNDGQNVFGDCHTLSGCSWQAAEAAAELITAGQLPPFLLVGIDHAGLTRSLEYTPYAPGTGLGGFRCGAAVCVGAPQCPGWLWARADDSQRCPHAAGAPGPPHMLRLPTAHRADAAHWPGGGVAQYLQRLRQEVLPWVATQYAASMDPADLGFGGSSFGAVAALWAGMQASTVRGGCPFGALLVESPSLWMAQEAFLQVRVDSSVVTGALQL